MASQPTTSDRLDQADTDTLTDHDRAILSNVENCLDAGLQLKKWWEQTDATNSYAERFETTCTFNQPDHSFSFFDQAPLHGQTLPVLGDVVDLFYDRLKGPTNSAVAEGMRNQLREFVLHYFMRISAFRPPQACIRSGRPAPPPVLRPLSWCPDEAAMLEGFGYEQVYYKLRETGRIGKFPAEERFAIVDVRELDQKYEWVVLKVRIFDFNFTCRPLGPAFPQVQIPLYEQQWAVMSRDFIVNEDDPEPGVFGAYGYGYAVLKDPADTGLQAYGPGHFDAGFQLFNFCVLANGETRVKLVFVVNRPEKILNLSLNPVTWGLTLADFMSLGLTSSLFAPIRSVLDQLPFGGSGPDPVFSAITLLNWFTGGLAARELCISRDDLEKAFLVQHFMQNYEMITGSLFTWRQIPDWLDSAALPRWVIAGGGA